MKYSVAFPSPSLNDLDLDIYCQDHTNNSRINMKIKVIEEIRAFIVLNYQSK